MHATTRLLISAALVVQSLAPPVHAADIAAELSTLAPGAIAWAREFSAGALRQGVALTPAQREIARRVGVARPEDVRVLVVDGIPLPTEPGLRGAALKVGLSSERAAGLTLGHAVLVRRGWENDLRLLSHELRHVAQYEQAGGIAPFLETHLASLARHGYHDSPYEVDARAHELESANGE